MTEEDIRQIFAKNVRMFRIKQNLSQMTLAEKADVAPNFINDIENCKKWISPNTLSKLCEALNVSAYQFFLPIQADTNENSELIQQFSDEVVNSIIESVRKIAEKY